MRKAINISAFLFFIWLVLDTLSVPSVLLNFLLVGELPGTQISLPPVIMLAILSTIFGVIIFETLARHIEITHRTRKQLLSISRRSQLPKRRFNRA